MLAGLNVVVVGSRYRDRSVGSTKFAHIGKFKKQENVLSVHKTSLKYRCTQKWFTVQPYTKPVYRTAVLCLKLS